jgi:hypothetical protein
MYKVSVAPLQSPQGPQNNKTKIAPPRTNTPGCAIPMVNLMTISSVNAKRTQASSGIYES